MTRRLFAALAAVLLALAAIPASASTDTFGDDDGSVHETDIEAIAAAGITKGCNPPSNDRFCPDDSLTRGEMATFPVRALGATDTVVPADAPDGFVDDETSVHESAIDTLASLGITRGCGAVLPDAGYETVTTPDGPSPAPQFTTQLVDVGVASASGSDRVVFEFDEGLPGYQVGYIGLPVIADPSGLTIAVEALLVRAFDYESPTGTDRFVDDNDSIFEADIEALAAAGITLGCNPPTNDRFCPTDPVTRAQMASFLVRALDL